MIVHDEVKANAMVVRGKGEMVRKYRDLVLVLPEPARRTCTVSHATFHPDPLVRECIVYKDAGHGKQGPAEMTGRKVSPTRYST